MHSVPKIATVKKRIVLCGGGSGGHITPLLSVADELRKKESNLQIVYIGERGGKFNAIAEQSNRFDELYFIRAGKFRRYNGEHLLTRLLDIKTIALNIRDIFRTLRGLGESIRLFRALKADAVLLKGGFVCVPAGIGAWLNHIPQITHDSDSIPGLSNRIIGRFARIHAVAMPAELYSYPKSRTQMVGVPVDPRFKAYSAKELNAFKKEFGLAKDRKVLLVTGGSNGARRLNTYTIEVLSKLLDRYPKLHVFHHVGAGNEQQYDDLSHQYKKQVTMFDFTSDLFKYSALADVVVTRAGATTLNEFAAQSKACVIVPNPDLTGGHQLKNADYYERVNASLVVHESAMKLSTEPLLEAIDLLLKDAKKRKQLATNMHKTLPRTPAARRLAEILLEL